MNRSAPSGHLLQMNPFKCIYKTIKLNLKNPAVIQNGKEKIRIRICTKEKGEKKTLQRYIPLLKIMRFRHFIGFLCMVLKLEPSVFLRINNFTFIRSEITTCLVKLSVSKAGFPYWAVFRLLWG